MAGVFVDANYYIAVLIERDRLHSSAVRAHEEVARKHLVTSDAVHFEVLNHMSKLGRHSRNRAVELFRRLHADPAISVVEFDDVLVSKALDLYAARDDKRHSLTDCLSIIICRERGITSVLTHDHNFEQEGFTILM